MRKTEKDLKVSCTECIHNRRILTCHENGRDCTRCKNACCCRKCSPDATGKELEYEQRKYFSPGMPMSEYVLLKNVKMQNTKYENAEHIDIVEQKNIEESSQNIQKKQHKKKESVRQEKQEIKKQTVPFQKQDVTDNLTIDKNGQLSFLWDE